MGEFALILSNKLKCLLIFRSFRWEIVNVQRYRGASTVAWETMTDDERDDLRRQQRKEEAYKTALCDAYKKMQTCPYGESCRFAHGENELRMPAQVRYS